MRQVKSGELIILHHGPRDHHLIAYQPEFSFGTRKGQILMPDPLHYGDTLVSSSGHPHHVLIPSTSDLILKMKRPTTIVYPKDAGWLFMVTHLQPGMRVLECGSGSGALTLLLARAAGEEGRVVSVERREDHLAVAKRTIEKHGLDSRVEFHHRDASAEGFPEGEVEGCFIDVPEPWELVHAAHEVTLGGGFWVSLSPTFNQVEKVVEALRKGGWIVMETVAITERRIKVRPGKTRPDERGILHTAFLTHAQKINERPVTDDGGSVDSGDLPIHHGHASE